MSNDQSIESVEIRNKTVVEVVVVKNVCKTRTSQCRTSLEW